MKIRTFNCRRLFFIRIRINMPNSRGKLFWTKGSHRGARGGNREVRGRKKSLVHIIRPSFHATTACDGFRAILKGYKGRKEYKKNRTLKKTLGNAGLHLLKNVFKRAQGEKREERPRVTETGLKNWSNNAIDGRRTRKMGAGGALTQPTF